MSLLLSIVYVNEIATGTDSRISKFAYDTKFSTIVVLGSMYKGYGVIFAEWLIYLISGEY